MGHAFICEYCECYHTVTDGCDEYDQNRANRIMVNNETQKENEMALEDVLAQKWQADKQKDVLERLYTYIRKIQPTGPADDAETLCVDSAKEIATLRTQLEHHRLAHDDAKAAWEKECSERDIAEEKLEAAERERDKARASNEVKRNALAIATRRLEFGRIWGGMEWVYQPMRAEQRKRTLDEIYAALDVARDLK